MISYCDHAQHKLEPGEGFITIEGGDAICDGCLAVMPKAQLANLRPLYPEQLEYVQMLEAKAS